MYKSIYYDKKRELLHVWDDTAGYLCQKFKNFAFRRSEFGKYQNLHGERVEKIYNFDYNTPGLFESDLPVETKALIELYGGSEEPAKNVKVLIIDIETDITGGFPSMTTFDKEITAFSYYEKSTQQYKCLILDKDRKVTPYIKDNVEVLSFDTEESLLKGILNVFEQIRPDIVTGWNLCYNGDGPGFDIPYIYGRICTVLGSREANRLSEIGQCYVKKNDKTVVIAGVSCIDYMFLYKKFRFEPRQNYRLDFIGKVELNKGKIQYTGNLNQLYKDDINKFIEYNLCDVEIVKLLDDKFKFLDLAVNVCTVGHVPYEWYHMSSRFIEGAIITYMRNHGNMVAPNKPIRQSEDEDDMIIQSASIKEDDEDVEDDDSYVGAYVKTPVPGLYSWVFSADINSLYPSTIRTLNISPETYIGRISDWDSEAFAKGKLTEIKIADEVYTLADFKKFINDEQINISTIGAMYNGKKLGIIPTVLELWFTQRLEFQAKVKEFAKAGNKEMEAHYTRLQHCQKIFLNSVYGILGLASSRLYSKDNAESTTLTGQTIIKLSEKIVIGYFLERYGKLGKIIEDTNKIVQYIDTDSVAGDSKVHTNLYGELSIENLFNNLKTDQSNVNITDLTGRDFIFTKNLTLPFYCETDKSIKTGHVKYVEKHRVKKRMFKIKTKSGKSVVVTEDHSVMVIRNSKLIKVLSKDIVDTDELVGLSVCITNFDVDKIDTIEDLGICELDVYDVGMVDSPHTFFANDILVHNSLYISVDELANFEGVVETDKKEFTKQICNEVVDRLNLFYPVLVKRMFNADHNKIKIAADTINETALWKKKKAYALNKVYDMGKGKDVKKIEIKGLSSVRSDCPPRFKLFLEKFLEDILYRVGKTKVDESVLTLKNELDTYNILELAKNTAVRFISHKKGMNFNPKNRTPFTVASGATAQCRASLMYIDLLDKFNLKKSVIPIFDGQKIKYHYLKENPYGLDALAFKGDGTDPKEIMDIIETYCDKQRMYDSVLNNKIEDFYNILGWKTPLIGDAKAGEFFEL